MTHHSVMTLRIKKFKMLTNLVIFRAISILTVSQIYLEMLSTLYFINVSLGPRKVSLGATKSLPAVQRKQAKRACIYKNTLIEF